ncbi:MAG: hypothetical protein JWQ33_661 [Ramlibacter sp.]|nr:hypothetical protein [Ramlibacter sp.]
MTTPEQKQTPTSDRDDFWSALCTGILVGAAALVIVLPAVHYWKRPVPTTFPNAPQVLAPATSPSHAGLPADPAAPLASFGKQKPTDAVRLVANWSVYSGDHQKMAFVIVDKKDARVWVFNPDGRLVANAPALLGAAIGDDSVPGIGDKPLAQVRPEEKTTPAGRFIAEPGNNLTGEDVVWVSYDLAVSMHRVRPIVKAERRLERLASPTPEDNRISFGCINLPPAFYEKVLSPTVKKYGAVIYVLPETRSPAEVLGAYNVPPPTHLAQR